MQFNTPLIKGKFVRRYKRFFVDAELENGETVVAHCANTGSMKGLKDEGNDAYLTPVDDPKRKLKYTLEMLGTPTSLVGVNTSRPNALVEEAILAGNIESLNGYENLKREVKYGQNSRIDIFLSGHGTLPNAYVEVKNVTLAEGNAALFPDAVTTRGAKHLDELVEMVDQGHRAVMFYLIQRTDCTHFSPAAEIDPTYTQKLKKAEAKGVEILAYSCKMSDTEIVVDQKVEIKL